MPRVFDNIEQSLLPTLRETLGLSHRADFCVGYFNLRGWRQIDSSIEDWAGRKDQCCRLLVGMHRAPTEELDRLFRAVETQPQTGISNAEANALIKKIVADFRRQLTIGLPTDADEAGLRRLVAQIRSHKLVVKLFLQYPLHAKLYLAFRQDPVTPIVGYLGSSNLTFAGLCQQGELNIDITDNDSCAKLSRWFEDRWNDRKCIDISTTLVDIIEESWARETLIPPYHIYVKMAYHLSQEARAGLAEYSIPADLDAKLFEFQKKAVQIAARKVEVRGGVLIGDVVGLGKTLVATALARVFESHGMDALIICPKNLVGMWESYRRQYGLRGDVLSISKVQQKLPDMRPYRLVIIDESHNLRNREGKRFGAIKQYIEQWDCRCILLTATPFNKVHQDLSNQLRLFIPEDRDIGVQPERLIQAIGADMFSQKFQCQPRTLAAFDRSMDIDDWRELMRLFMIRRTRSFIEANYTKPDPATGRKYLDLENGGKSYFPVRRPRTVAFGINDSDPTDQYARLYSEPVVHVINDLLLPRYGLGNYLHPNPPEPPTDKEADIIASLSRAGKRLIGYCRTNLFKRLESCGNAFIESIERHILRNYVFLHAIENGEPLPLGTQNAEMLDPRLYDEDTDTLQADFDFAEIDDDEGDDADTVRGTGLCGDEDFRRCAAAVYEDYRTEYARRFKWLRPSLFRHDLAVNLRRDSAALLDVLRACGRWNPDRDAKLAALRDIVQKSHPCEKVLVFSQFADTVRYVAGHLHDAGIDDAIGVTGKSTSPYDVACRFSPVSNGISDTSRWKGDIRVLVATDVLSEGQNLQDCSIVVNYDLPWAIIRLIQRAGRVDRIGQLADTVQCYSFLPASGVERIINLRARVRARLLLNAEIVGTDEVFFEDDAGAEAMRDLYNEKAGVLDDERDTETDLTSRAYEIWKQAIEADPSLEKTVTEMPDVVFATKHGKGAGGSTPDAGALVYQRTARGNDALIHVAPDGHVTTASQSAILDAAECAPDTPALPRRDDHHGLVAKAVDCAATMDVSPSGQLRGLRKRVYDRLAAYARNTKGTIFESHDLELAVADIYGYPLHQQATGRIADRLKSGATDGDLAKLVVALRADDRLCVKHDDETDGAPQIICSMGLVAPGEET